MAAPFTVREADVDYQARTPKRLALSLLQRNYAGTSVAE
jgi:hypothetical protein